MHRAEKASSRICRTREVERAQELHRKKLDDVKSHLTGIVSRPPPIVRPVVGATFRRFKPAASSLSLHSATARTNDADGDEDDVDDDAEESDDDALDVDEEPFGGASSGDSGLAHAQLKLVTNKTDEFRSVAPVPIAGKHSHRQHFAKAPTATATHTKGSLNGAFRSRRLKAIESDNVSLFDRIRKTAAHYRNDDLKREWDQNVSYLSSICEFPVVLTSPRGRLHPYRHDSSSDSSISSGEAGLRMGPSTPVRRLHEALPSIHQPAVVHPIRAVPTSPRRLQLNLSPAFRSLRKSMPQQPALPPIAATSSSNVQSLASPSSPSSTLIAGGGSTSTVSQVRATAAAASPGIDNVSDAGSDDDADTVDYLTDSDVSTLPSRATSIGSPFIGDLSSVAATSRALLDETKYEVLKLGRFVGGTYLVLTVVCGDGVSNPYGFDVLAFDRASQCAFRLCVTKQMTHELLDVTSSVTQAAATAAAAGTNLSMEHIARSICDHVNFASLESGCGEMAFLSTSVGGVHSDCALLLDCASSSLALCIHQCVEMELPATVATGKIHKRRLHVYASTRPQTSMSAAYDDVAVGRYCRSNSSSSDTTDDAQTICFQVRNDDRVVPMQLGGSTSRLAATDALDLKVEVQLSELYAIVGEQWHGRGDSSLTVSTNKSKSKKTRLAASASEHCCRLADRVSIERVVVAAIRHLHIVNVPRGDASDELVLVLVVNRYVNALLLVVPTPTERNKLATTRSRQPLPRAAATSPIRSLSRAEPTSTCLLESGVLWKSVYVVARITIDIVSRSDSDSDGDSDHSDSDGSISGRVEQSIPQYIQDVDGLLRVVVFNTLTCKSAERTLSAAQVDAVVAKLRALIPADDPTEFQESVAFAKQLLLRLQLEVDRFGNEVLTFPTLGIKQRINSHTELQRLLHRDSCLLQSDTTRRHRLLATRGASDRTAPSSGRDSVDEVDDKDADDCDNERDAASTRIQAIVRAYLIRKQCYGSDRDDELLDDADCKALDQLTELQRRGDSRDGSSEWENDNRSAYETSRYSDATHRQAAVATVLSDDVATEPTSSSSSLERDAIASTGARIGAKLGDVFCLMRDTAARGNIDRAEADEQTVCAIGALGALHLRRPHGAAPHGAAPHGAAPLDA